MNYFSFSIRLFVFVFSILLAHPMVAQKKKQSLKILVISDLNDSYGSTTYSTEVHDMMGKLQEIKPDLILCGGDMVAGQKASLTTENLQAMWAGFEASVLNPIDALQIPFGFTVGNHDASPSYLKDRAAASAFWTTNKLKTRLQFVDDGHYPYYFSYVQDNLFFISWDASSALITEDIKIWMKKQLASKQAIKARGRIVLGHLPLYALVEAKNKQGEVLNEADQTLAFLKQNNVDMYISGHQHVYYPANKEKVTLLHSGCLGGGPRPLLGHSAPPQKAYALIELPRKGKFNQAVITGFNTNQHETISLDSLPASVTGFNGTVNRIDQRQ